MYIISSSCSYIDCLLNWLWSHAPVISTLREQRQEDFNEFRTSSVDTVGFRPSRTSNKTLVFLNAVTEVE